MVESVAAGRLEGSGSNMLTRVQVELSRLEMLMRTEIIYPPHSGMTFYQALTSRGGVYHAGSSVARLENSQPVVDASWSVVYAVAGSGNDNMWPPYSRHWPFIDHPEERGWTQ